MEVDEVFKVRRKKEKAILFANIGISDLGKNNKSIYEGIKDNIYDDSKMKYERHQWYDLNAILLEPVIDYIQDQEYLLDSVYLFGTEQKPKVHPQDTIYIARIVKMILKGKGINEENIKIQQITENVADRDAMYKFYENYFSSFQSSCDIVFASLTGGTPAQNEALLLESVKKFGLRLQGIYLPKGSNEIKILTVGEKIYKEFLINQYKVLKNRHQYSGAIGLAEKYGLIEWKDLELLKAENYKFLFDFENSIRCLENALNCSSGIERTKIEIEIEKLKKMQTLDKIKIFDKEYFSIYLTLIEELYENMKIEWECGNYVDFLGRLVRLEEALLRFAFEYHTKVSTAMENMKFEDFENYMEKNTDIKAFLEKEGVKSYGINILVLNKCLGYFASKDTSNRELISKVKKFTDSLTKLTELRNRSIMGHGFGGVSEKIIKECYEGNLLMNIEEIINYIKKYI